VPTRILPVAEGVSLNAQAWGEGEQTASPPFLLVHGLSSNCRTFEAVGDLLHAAGYPVASVDLRGHGQSDKPDDGYDFATLTADLLAAMATLGFDRPVVVGQSTGGNLAVELAHRASERVAGVVGIDGGVIDLQRRWPRWEDCEAALAPPVFAGVDLGAFEAMIRKHHPDWSDWAVEATAANCEVLENGTVRPWLSRHHHMRILRALWDHRPIELLPVGVPTLLVFAQREEAEDARILGSETRVEWLPGDHDLHVQQPDRVFELILDAHG
jgi:pimeloyl-ACP methyl ester carboxylesterase